MLKYNEFLKLNENQSYLNDLLSGTWTYKDNDDEYHVQFLKDGTIKMNHPLDSSHGNDKWELKNGKYIKFTYNDEFSIHVGEFKNPNLIEGNAYRKEDNSLVWDWQLYKQEVTA